MNIFYAKVFATRFTEDDGTEADESAASNASASTDDSGSTIAYDDPLLR